jgi:hypothetical protein
LAQTTSRAAGSCTSPFMTMAIGVASLFGWFDHSTRIVAARIS